MHSATVRFISDLSRCDFLHFFATVSMISYFLYNRTYKENENEKILDTWLEFEEKKMIENPRTYIGRKNSFSSHSSSSSSSSSSRCSSSDCSSTCSCFEKKSTSSTDNTIYVKMVNEKGEDVYIHKNTKNIYKYPTKEHGGVDFSSLTVDVNIQDKYALVSKKKLKKLKFLEKNSEAIIKCFMDGYTSDKTDETDETDETDYTDGLDRTTDGISPFS